MMNNVNAAGVQNQCMSPRVQRYVMMLSGGSREPVSTATPEV